MNRKAFISSLLIISIFAAFTFESFHTDHEINCHEEDCPVCLVLQVIHNTNTIGQSVTSTSAEFITFFFLDVIILSALLFIPATLVKQKVKLVI